MAITQADILTIVKARLGLDDSKDELINSYIFELENRILHYCNVDTVPDGLKYTWASMVIDVLRIDQPNDSEIADTVGGAESVKIGDTQVTPARSTGGDISNTSKSVIDSVALNYRIDLNRYRKLRW